MTPGYEDFVEDLLAPLGLVAVRRLFGAAGVFHDGIMFAILRDGCLYLRVDDASRGDFEQAGARPFTYATRNGEKVIGAYYALPEDFYDEPEIVVAWARRAVEAARQARRPTSRRRVRRPAVR